MQIKIHTFGIARDICGGPVISLALPDYATARQLKQHLMERYPRLGDLSSFLLAVNEEYAEPDTPIQPQDEIALIPPVSGG
ncbi:MAG: molybdopterin converting factor subunit 1 [Saprospiraceae bacterium]